MSSTPTISEAANETINENEHKETFTINIKNALRDYFTQLDGEPPVDLYELVLAEIELPLFNMIIQFANGNQSKAAKMLGMSRGTLRKKLALYGVTA